jgi:hypothetical protein
MDGMYRTEVRSIRIDIAPADPRGAGYAHAIDELIQWYCSGTLALDGEEAGSPRDEAIDAVSTRPREDQPNEDQRV